MHRASIGPVFSVAIPKQWLFLSAVYARSCLRAQTRFLAVYKSRLADVFLRWKSFQTR